MAKRNTVRGVNRAIAVVLAVVWLCAGAIGVFVGLREQRWLLVAVAVAAIAYAVLWLQVAARSRLLTWRELTTPWRSGS